MVLNPTVNKAKDELLGGKDSDIVRIRKFRREMKFTSIVMIPVLLGVMGMIGYIIYLSWTVGIGLGIFSTLFFGGLGILLIKLTKEMVRLTWFRKKKND
jgi:hypothetical protein